jgi:hypothetical protein
MWMCLPLNYAYLVEFFLSPLASSKVGNVRRDSANGLPFAQHLTEHLHRVNP